MFSKFGDPPRTRTARRSRPDRSARSPRARPRHRRGETSFRRCTPAVTDAPKMPARSSRETSARERIRQVGWNTPCRAARSTARAQSRASEGPACCPVLPLGKRIEPEIRPDGCGTSVGSGEAPTGRARPSAPTEGWFGLAIERPERAAESAKRRPASPVRATHLPCLPGGGGKLRPPGVRS